MDLLEIAKRRQSQRTYLTGKMVEADKLQRCLETARLAPSACNSQPWHFIIVDTPELVRQVGEATESKLLNMNSFVVQAPVLAVLVNEGSSYKARLGEVLKNRTYDLIDIGIATSNFCNQATAEGLSTCILGWFDEKRIQKLLGIPRKKRIELVITVGYADTDKIREKKRKPLSEMATYNTY